MTRRHPDSTHMAVPSTRRLHVNDANATPPAAVSRPHVADTEFAHELEEIRERLRNTESQLVDERNSRNELLKKVNYNRWKLF